MLDAFRLIPALQLIFRTEIEFTADSFVELNRSQREVFQQKMGDSDDRIYRVVLLEPTVVQRQDKKVTLELSVVTESERQHVTNSCSSSRTWNQLPAFRTKSSFAPTRNVPLDALSWLVIALLQYCCRSRFASACGHGACREPLGV